MFNVHFLSALYVSPPPIARQKLFDNNITAVAINFSEYFFSIPFRYPNYLVSPDLNLTEVQTSTLNRVGLVALWVLLGAFWKTLGKVVVVFAVIKVGNRLGFVQPPKPRNYSLPNPPPVHHLPSRTTSPPHTVIYPRPSPLRTSVPKKEEPKPPPGRVSSLLGSFVVVDPPKKEEPKPSSSPDLELMTSLDSFVLVEDSENEKKDQGIPPPLPSHDLSASSSFVMVNPDEVVEDPPSHSLSQSWVVLGQERGELFDSYHGDSLP